MPQRNRSRTLKLILRILSYWEVWVILLVLTAGLVIAFYPQFYKVQETRSEQSEALEIAGNLPGKEQKLKNSDLSRSSSDRSRRSNQLPQLLCSSKLEFKTLEQVNYRQEIQTLAASTNRGEREVHDRTSQKNTVLHEPMLIVLHETVIPLDETLKLFQTSTNNENAQLSYHVVIGRNGDRYRVVPDEERAFGAGNSDFRIIGPDGRPRSLAVALNPNLPSSINNVALHVSLETPPDGNREVPSHSGYTEEQYAALAKVVGDWMETYRLDSSRIVTHKQVDRDGRKKDPRSFDASKFATYLDSYRKLGLCRPS